MGQIRGFFRSDFSVFGAEAPNALKSDLKKPGFVPFGANLTTLEPNLPPMAEQLRNVPSSGSLEQEISRSLAVSGSLEQEVSLCSHRGTHSEHRSLAQTVNSSSY